MTSKTRLHLISAGLVVLVLLSVAMVNPERASAQGKQGNQPPLPVSVVNTPLSVVGDLALVHKGSFEVDVRSAGRVVADEMAASPNLVAVDEGTTGPGLKLGSGSGSPRDNQVNDPSLDNIQIFAGFRPFVKFTQSETSVAAFGSQVVATYNSSANQPLVEVAPGVLAFVRRFFSAFSVSTDEGRTWTSGFFPPLPGSIFTFGDPVVAVDRIGNFYFAGLGADSLGRFTIQVNKSTDGGLTWGDAVLVQRDAGGDKEWLAVGPDPEKNRDNVYVSWTSFQPSGTQLRFGVSTDGGQKFTTKTIFAPAPDPNPANPQSFLQFSVATVDPANGRLYIPFLHFSNSDQDFIRILVSDDAGVTFSFASFNAPGAPTPTLLPVTAAGELIDCGNPGGGLRLTIHAGPDIGGGRFGLRRFVNAARLVTQPAFAARGGRLYLAWSNSTSQVFGAPTSKSNILFMRSLDGGATWEGPIAVTDAGATGALHHVLPHLAVGDGRVFILYYRQNADETVDVEMVVSDDDGGSFGTSVKVTDAPFRLAPTNIPIPTDTLPFRTTSYDRLVVPCYSLGEYLSVNHTPGDGRPAALWGGSPNLVTEPVNPLNPISGQTHPQQDVFFQRVRLR